MEKIRLQFAPMAQLSALYVNAHLKESARPVSPEDFMPASVVDREPPKLKDELEMFNRFLKVAK